MLSPSPHLLWLAQCCCGCARDVPSFLPHQKMVGAAVGAEHCWPAGRTPFCSPGPCQPEVCREGALCALEQHHVVLREGTLSLLSTSCPLAGSVLLRVRWAPPYCPAAESYLLTCQGWLASSAVFTVIHPPLLLWHRPLTWVAGCCWRAGGWVGWADMPRENFSCGWPFFAPSCYRASQTAAAGWVPAAGNCSTAAPNLYGGWVLCWTAGQAAAASLLAGSLGRAALSSKVGGWHAGGHRKLPDVGVGEGRCPPLFSGIKTQAWRVLPVRAGEEAPMASVSLWLGILAAFGLQHGAWGSYLTGMHHKLASCGVTLAHLVPALELQRAPTWVAASCWRAGEGALMFPAAAKHGESLQQLAWCAPSRLASVCRFCLAGSGWKCRDATFHCWWIGISHGQLWDGALRPCPSVAPTPGGWVLQEGRAGDPCLPQYAVNHGGTLHHVSR